MKLHVQAFVAFAAASGGCARDRHDDIRPEPSPSERLPPLLVDNIERLPSLLEKCIGEGDMTNGGISWFTFEFIGDRLSIRSSCFVVGSDPHCAATTLGRVQWTGPSPTPAGRSLVLLVRANRGFGPVVLADDTPWPGRWFAQEAGCPNAGEETRRVDRVFDHVVR